MKTVKLVAKTLGAVLAGLVGLCYVIGGPSLGLHPAWAVAVGVFMTLCCCLNWGL